MGHAGWPRRHCVLPRGTVQRCMERRCLSETVISWPLMIGGVVGENEEVATDEPDNPEERENTHPLKMWLQLAVKQQRNRQKMKHKIFHPALQMKEWCFPHQLWEEQIPTSPDCPFIVFREDLVPP